MIICGREKENKRKETTHFACCEPTALLLCAATIYVEDYHPESKKISSESKKMQL